MAAPRVRGYADRPSRARVHRRHSRGRRPPALSQCRPAIVTRCAMMKSLCLVLALLCVGSTATAGSTAQSESTLHAALQRDLDDYLAARAKVEHVSAISLSIDLHGPGSNINVTAGRAQYGGEGEAVTPDDLWQIGSNTKAFTAATILQLEAEGKLTIDQTVGHWLPQYPAWKHVTIHRLLDMTSGIPNYSETEWMSHAWADEPKRDFTFKELVDAAYPSATNKLPVK